jgi:hypothetical protein
MTFFNTISIAKPRPILLPDREIILHTIDATLLQTDSSFLILESMERHFNKTIVEIPANSVRVIDFGHSVDNGVRLWAELGWMEGNSEVRAIFELESRHDLCNCVLIYQTENPATLYSLTLEWVVSDIQYLKKLFEMPQRYLRSLGWSKTKRQIFDVKNGNIYHLTKSQYRSIFTITNNIEFVLLRSSMFLISFPVTMYTSSMQSCWKWPVKNNV